MPKFADGQWGSYRLAVRRKSATIADRASATSRATSKTLTLAAISHEERRAGRASDRLPLRLD